MARSMLCWGAFPAAHLCSCCPVNQAAVDKLLIETEESKLLLQHFCCCCSQGSFLLPAGRCLPSTKIIHTQQEALSVGTRACTTRKPRRALDLTTPGCRA